MDTAVLIAIIGAGGAIIGALIRAYAYEWKTLLSGRAGLHSDLVGPWNCSWTVTKGAETVREIVDVVNIARVWGETFRGGGASAQTGGYKFRGRISRSLLVTLHYEGVDSRQPLGGVVILKLNPTRRSMTGYWYQYQPDESIIGGRTTWEKSSL